MMAKQMMEGAAKQIRDNVNKEVASYKKQAIVGKLQAVGPENVEVIKGLTEDSIDFTIHKVNDTKRIFSEYGTANDRISFICRSNDYEYGTIKSCNRSKGQLE